MRDSGEDRLEQMVRRTAWGSTAGPIGVAIFCASLSIDVHILSLILAGLGWIGMVGGPLSSIVSLVLGSRGDVQYNKLVAWGCLFATLLFLLCWFMVAPMYHRATAGLNEIPS